jgi:hypothetical protein
LAFCHAGIADLEKLVEPTTRGHPEICLRWTCKSVRKLAAELRELGHQVSDPVVAELLHELDYSLQANRKTKEGKAHPDRNAQLALHRPEGAGLPWPFASRRRCACMISRFRV